MLFSIFSFSSFAIDFGSLDHSNAIKKEITQIFQITEIENAQTNQIFKKLLNSKSLDNEFKRICEIAYIGELQLPRDIKISHKMKKKKLMTKIIRTAKVMHKSVYLQFIS